MFQSAVVCCTGDTGDTESAREARERQDGGAQGQPKRVQIREVPKHVRGFVVRYQRVEIGRETLHGLCITCVEALRSAYGVWLEVQRMLGICTTYTQYLRSMYGVHILRNGGVSIGLRWFVNSELDSFQHYLIGKGYYLVVFMEILRRSAGD